MYQYFFNFRLARLLILSYKFDQAMTDKIETKYAEKNQLNSLRLKNE